MSVRYCRTFNSSMLTNVSPILQNLQFKHVDKCQSDIQACWQMSVRYSSMLTNVSPIFKHVDKCQSDIQECWQMSVRYSSMLTNVSPIFKHVDKCQSDIQACWQMSVRYLFPRIFCDPDMLSYASNCSDLQCSRHA